VKPFFFYTVLHKLFHWCVTEILMLFFTVLGMRHSSRHGDWRCWVWFRGGHATEEETLTKGQRFWGNKTCSTYTVFASFCLRDLFSILSVD